MMHLLPVVLALATLASGQDSTQAPEASVSASSVMNEDSMSTSASAAGSASASASESVSVTSASATAAVSAAPDASSAVPSAPAGSGDVPVFSIPSGVVVDPLPPPGPDARYMRDPNITAPLVADNIQHFNARWRKAHEKATAFLKDWTPEEKVQLVTGSGWMQDRCVGNTPAIPERDWKGLCLQDGPAGIRFASESSVFTPAINVASTFDKQLMFERGRAMGYEFKHKGINVALAPMTNMGRVAAGGRNWEGFGGDPYLSGWATYQSVKGLQKAGVQACVKHYILNENERIRHKSSSNIDDRPLHEVYLHPFLKAVQADVASVMSSYNLINGTHADYNSKTLNDILKTELGFAGYVMSDWDGTNSGWPSANNGLDMTMPGDIGMDGGKSTWWGPDLIKAVNNGTVTSGRFDDMAQRIMASYFLLEQDKNYPDVNFDSWNTGGPNNSHVDVMRDHDVLIRKMGAASTVLLKNTDNALPLKHPKHIAVIGSDMGPSAKGPNGWPDRGGDEGTLAIGWGSGTGEFPWLVSPLASIARKAHEDHSILNWWLQDWDTDRAAKLAADAQVAIVGVNSNSGEEYITVDQNVGDRNNLSAWNNGDNLIQAVAAQCNNTIVIVHSVGPMHMEQWIDHPNITGVLWAGLPGQESGDSLVDVLYGDYNPSGRLPYTIARNRSHYPAEIDYVPTDSPYTNVNYEEGLDIDYRHFLRRGIEPRFPFGYGGSYTKFDFSNIRIESTGDRNETQPEDDLAVEQDNAQEAEQLKARGKDHGHHDEDDTAFGRSVSKKLHAPKWTISADITNTGDVNGCEVPQLYISFPEESGEPPRVLRDFDRINLDPGASQTVSFKLADYDLSIWDVVTQRWVIPDGKFTAIVARHSFDDEGVSNTFCPGKC